MKHCCHITVAHPARDNRILRKECQTLAAAGYRVTLIAPAVKDGFVGDVRISAIIPSASRRHRFFISNWRALFAALKQKADVYHFHDPDFLIFGFAGLLKIITQKPVIYDAHEDYAQVILSREWIPAAARRILSKILSYWEKFCARVFVDYVITATPAIAKKFRARHAVDVKNYPLKSDFSGYVAKRAFPVSGKKFCLVYAGGMEKIRGIEEIVRALEYLRFCRLLLMGSFSEEKFANEIKKMNGWQMVDFYQRLKYEEVVANFKKSDIGMVCLHPIGRFRESLPVKMFEYMASGIPIIASNFAEWQKIIESDGCGICVDPLDSKKIAAAVNYLIANPKKALEMGERGRQAFLREFNWSREGEKLILIYEKLMLNKSRRNFVST